MEIDEIVFVILAGTEDQNLQFLLNSPQISNDIDHNLMVNMDLVHVQNELHDDLSSYSTINEIRTIDPSVMEDTIHLPKGRSSLLSVFIH